MLPVHHHQQGAGVQLILGRLQPVLPRARVRVRRPPAGSHGGRLCCSFPPGRWRLEDSSTQRLRASLAIYQGPWETEENYSRNVWRVYRLHCITLESNWKLKCILFQARKSLNLIPVFCSKVTATTEELRGLAQGHTETPPQLITTNSSSRESRNLW